MWTVEGPGASRLYGPGDGASRLSSGRPGGTGSPVPPALEPPTTASTPGQAEASEPGPSGPQGPILDTPTGTISSELGVLQLSPAGQRAFNIPGVPSQLALDGTASELNVGQSEAEPEPVECHDTRQPPLPLPEPWRDGSQLRLDVAYVPPAGASRFFLDDYQAALAATWASLVAWMEAHRWDAKELAFARRRAREVLVCGDTWRVFEHECGYLDETHAVLIEGCDSRGCPRCAKAAATKYRMAGYHYVKTHPVARVKGRVSRGYFLTTLTEPKPEFLTLDGLSKSIANVKRKGSNAWKKVCRFNPRRADGVPGKYPGKCSDAGMVCRVEVGPHGNVHAHVLRYGAYHRSEDVRWATGGDWTHDTRVRQDERGARGGVNEVLKYVMKGSTKPGRREFVHPSLAVLVELAAHRRRLVEGYGTMRGLVHQAEEAYLEERQGVMRDEGERLAERQLVPCPCCGKTGGWKWKNVSNPHKRKRAPPPGRHPPPPELP